MRVVDGFAKVQVPPLTASGSKLVLPGKGARLLGDPRGARGDHVLTVRVSLQSNSLLSFFASPTRTSKRLARGAERFGFCEFLFDFAGGASRPTFPRRQAVAAAAQRGAAESLRCVDLKRTLLSSFLLEPCMQLPRSPNRRKGRCAFPCAPRCERWRRRFSEAFFSEVFSD